MTHVLIRNLERDRYRRKIMRRLRKKTAMDKPRREASEEINLADTLISGS